MTEQANQPATTKGGAATGTGAKPPAAASRKPRPSLARRIATVLFIIVVLGGLWISWPAWSPSLPGWLRGPLAPVMEAGRGGGLAARTDAIEKRLAGVEGEVAALRQRVANQPRPSAAEPSGRISDQLRAVSGRVDALDREFAEIRQHLAQVDPLRDRVAALDSAIKGLSANRPAPSNLPAPNQSGQTAPAPSSSPPAGPPPASAAALAQVKAEAEAAVTRLQQQNRQLADRIAAADKRLAALEETAKAAGGAARGSAFVLAVGQLRDAVRSGRPFAGALSGLRAIAGNDPDVAAALATLRPFAGSGVADLAMLRSRFALAARRIAAAAPKNGGGWVDRTLSRLSSVVSIRRTGPDAAAGHGADAAVARAEMALDSGDIAGAVNALEGLDGGARDAAAPWLADARARLAADAAVASLEAEAIGQLGGAAPGASGG